MPKYQYASAPAVPPPPTVAIIAGTISNQMPRWFWLSYRTRSGYSVHSSAVSAIAATGYRITIPAIARPSPVGGVYGGDIMEYVVHMNNTNDAATSVIVATFPEYDNLGNHQALPAIINLTTDEQVEIDAGLIVNTTANLPSAPVHGMRRTVVSPSQFLAYDAVFSPIGWKPAYPPLHTIFLSSNEVQYGMNQEIDAIADERIILTVPYAVDGSMSAPIKIWITNSEPTPVPQGTPIGLAIEINGQDFSDRFIGLIVLKFDGFVNTTTCALDVVSMVTNVEIPYQGNRTNLLLQKNLPSGSAVQLSVFLRFNPFQINNAIANGTTIRIAPYFFTDYAVFTPIANILGSFIANEFDLRRIVPDGAGLFPKALKGSGVIYVNEGVGGYSFFGVPESLVAGLVANTANQEVLINTNGECFRSVIPQAGTALRAIVGTVNGQGRLVRIATGVAISPSTQIRVTIVYPTAIRGDYPDVIANNDKGRLNATAVRFNLTIASTSTTIYTFDFPIIPLAVSQTFDLGSFATNATNSPSTDPAFGLYEVEPSNTTITPLTIASVFINGTVDISVSFVYSNTVTSISHSVSDGCIYEATASLATIFETLRYFAPPLNDATQFRNLPLERMVDGQLRWNRGNNRYYVFVGTSLQADDGTNNSLSYKPASYPVSQQGRWLFIMDAFAPQLRFFRSPLPNNTAFQTLPSDQIFDGQMRVNLANGRIYVMRFGHTPTAGFDEIPSTITGAFWVWAGGGLNEIDKRLSDLQRFYYGAFANTAQVRSLTSTNQDGAILFVNASGKLYRWNGSSSLLDDGTDDTSAIQQGSTSGRWLPLDATSGAAQPLPNAAAFRNLSLAGVPDGQLRVNLDNGRLYIYLASSVGVDDNTPTSPILTPTTGIGRWVWVGGSEIIDLHSYFRAPLANAAAFRALPSAGISAGQLRINLDTGAIFRYVPTATDFDDGTATSIAIKPSDIPATSAGRWLIAIAGASAASAAAVIYFVGNPSTITPSVSRSIFFTDNRRGGSMFIAKQSSLAGSLYEYLPFKLLDAIVCDPITGDVIYDPIAETIVYDENVQIMGTGSF